MDQDVEKSVIAIWIMTLCKAPGLSDGFNTGFYTFNKNFPYFHQNKHVKMKGCYFPKTQKELMSSLPTSHENPREVESFQFNFKM